MLVEKRARHIARTLGVRHAASYLRKRRVKLGMALFMLLGVRCERMVYGPDGRWIPPEELERMR